MIAYSARLKRPDCLHLLGQVVVGKRYVTGFLRQMNVGDLVQQRGHLSRAALLQCLLIVQWLFTAQHPDEWKMLGIATDETHDRPEDPGHLAAFREHLRRCG